MFKFSLIFVFYVSSFLVFGQSKELQIIKFSELEKLISQPNNKVKVFNFCATWCAPCIKELPYFEKANKKFDNSSVEITLVNLDFADQYNKVLKFMDKHQLKSKIVLLDEVDYNSWIDKISTDWSGAIPATVVIDKKGERHFMEGELEQSEIFELIKQSIN